MATELQHKTERKQEIPSVPSLVSSAWSSGTVTLTVRSGKKRSWNDSGSLCFAGSRVGRTRNSVNTSCHVCKCTMHNVSPSVHFVTCKCGMVYCSRPRCSRQLSLEWETYKTLLLQGSECPHCAHPESRTREVGMIVLCPNSDCRAKRTSNVLRLTRSVVNPTTAMPLASRREQRRAISIKADGELPPFTESPNRVQPIAPAGETPVQALEDIPAERVRVVLTAHKIIAKLSTSMELVRRYSPNPLDDLLVISQVFETVLQSSAVMHLDVDALVRLQAHIAEMVIECQTGHPR
jgi:hypothetical protein